MNLKQKVLLLATVPLILAISAISILVTYQTQRLSNDEIAAFERNMVNAKKLELLNYLSLAQTSIRHIYDPAESYDLDAKRQVKEILKTLTYGEDGYFFVYDFEGTSLVHPKQPELIGNNWWELKDTTGNLVIQHLIFRAQEGGGFHRYLWAKPSSGEIRDKISYAIALDKWNWMLGTGLYIDDVIAQVAEFELEVEERIRETSVIILIITFTALGGVFVTGIAINLHERRVADGKLKDLTQRIIETQEEERGRVARELHDGISQILVSIKYAHEVALKKAQRITEDTEGVAGAIEKGANALNIAINEVRRISRDLRPSLLDDLGLSPALESLAHEFSERTNIKIKIGTVTFKNLLPKDAKTTLFRVAQEALTNIERHANADHVDINLAAHQGIVTLEISDNGSGFDIQGLNTKKDPLAGIGLRNMQERMEHHGGELDITSSPSGTKIVATLPKGILRTEAEIKS
ncbi:cache domain-containing protein [Kiloniella sp.]|uniref:cache domain-containing protein n=1 Tax=Kiloniella sp. TaxID=1938587 RepID=UPI003A8E2367